MNKWNQIYEKEKEKETEGKYRMWRLNLKSCLTIVNEDKTVFKKLENKEITVETAYRWFLANNDMEPKQLSIEDFVVWVRSLGWEV